MDIHESIIILIGPCSLCVARIRFVMFGDKESIALGTKAPKADLKMADISGKEMSLDQMVQGISAFSGA